MGKWWIMNDMGKLLGNLAQDKVAYHSSQWMSSVAGLAVDGNSNPDFNAGSCQATSSQAQPWWKVDLGELCHVYAVSLVNRITSCEQIYVYYLIHLINFTSALNSISNIFFNISAHRLNNFEIRIGTDAVISNNVLCASFDGVFGSAATRRFECNETIFCSNWVSVQRLVPIPQEANAVLTICEVEVYGMKEWERLYLYKQNNDSQA